MKKRYIAETVALSFLGKPYYWGGDDPVRGFDCSGYVIEILKSVGLLPRHGDWTAAGLMAMFKNQSVADAGEGRLVFWENSEGRIIHVEFCLNGELSIGASGGGSKTITEQAAIDSNAYIKIRPIYSRPRVAGFVDPWLTNGPIEA